MGFLSKNYQFLFVLILFGSCYTTDKQQLASDPLPITFDLDAEYKSVHLTGLIKGVSIVHIDDETVLGNIVKVINRKDLLYFLDRDQMAVNIYKKNGEFVNKICAAGQAPNEYIQLVDIFIDSVNSTLNLVSRVDKKLFKYTIDGAELIEIEKLPTYYFNMSKKEDEYFGFLGNHTDSKNDDKNLSMLHNDLTVKHNFFDVDKGFENYHDATVQPFSIYNGQLYYIQPLDYNIYLFDNDGYDIKYRIDFGKRNWPNGINSLQKMDNMSPTEKTKYVKNVNMFQETSDYLMTLFLYGGQKYLGLYDKKESKTEVTILDTYTKDLFFPFGTIVGIDERSIYTVIDATHIKSILNGSDGYNNFAEKHPKQIETMRTLFEGLELNDDSNGFLVTYSVL